jgi:hypothetical protein
MLDTQGYKYAHSGCVIQNDTKKPELLRNPTKIEEIQGKKMY